MSHYYLLFERDVDNDVLKLKRGDLEIVDGDLDVTDGNIIFGGGPKIFNAASDPATPGTTADKGSICLCDDGKLYVKSGTTATEWTALTGA